VSAPRRPVCPDGVAGRRGRRERGGRGTRGRSWRRAEAAGSRTATTGSGTVAGGGTGRDEWLLEELAPLPSPPASGKVPRVLGLRDEGAGVCVTPKVTWNVEGVERVAADEHGGSPVVLEDDGRGLHAQRDDGLRHAVERPAGGGIEAGQTRSTSRSSGTYVPSASRWTHDTTCEPDRHRRRGRAAVADRTRVRSSGSDPKPGDEEWQEDDREDRRDRDPGEAQTTANRTIDPRPLRASSRNGPPDLDVEGPREACAEIPWRNRQLIAQREDPPAVRGETSPHSAGTRRTQRGGRRARRHPPARAARGAGRRRASVPRVRAAATVRGGARAAAGRSIARPFGRLPRVAG